MTTATCVATVEVSHTKLLFFVLRYLALALTHMISNVDPDLLCCDFCSKAYHLQCHLPPLHEIPSGLWKCQECAALEYTRKMKCGECEACKRDDCGTCGEDTDIA